MARFGRQDDPASYEAAAMEAPNVPLPRRDPNGRVYNHRGKHIGALRYTHIGTPSFMVCAYCCNHRCSKVVRMTKEPTEEGILRWLARGTGLHTKEDHLREFNAFAFGG